MNLIYSTSDEYSELAAISIASVLENSKDAEQIDVYVIDKGINELHKGWLESLVSSYCRKLIFLPNIDIEKIADIKINVGRWHISTFSRLFVLHVLPEDMKKIIYIDCDMIIRYSLSELWNMDMEGTWCMSADDCRGKLYRKDIGIPEDSIYTNNGLMVIDLEAWRQNRVEEKFIEFIQRYNGDITYMDQGVLNGVFHPLKKVKLISVSYNAQTAFYDLGYDGLQACRKPVWAYTKEEFNKGVADPIIVHFTTCFLSGTRPWIENDNHPYKKEFFKYRELTSWKNEPLWKDHTPFKKKLMTKVCRILPRKLTFFFISIVHVYLYPLTRSFKNGGYDKK